MTMENVWLYHDQGARLDRHITQHVGRYRGPAERGDRWVEAKRLFHDCLGDDQWVCEGVSRFGQFPFSFLHDTGSPLGHLRKQKDRPCQRVGGRLVSRSQESEDVRANLCPAELPSG